MTTEHPPQNPVVSETPTTETTRMDFMLDLETMDTAETAAVTAIGGVFFEPHSDTLGDSYLTTISLESAVQSGRTMSASTVAWWLNQPKEAQDAMLANNTQHPVAIRAFAVWLSNRPFKLGRIWANSPSFDCRIMQSCFEGLNLPWPFKFYYERDVRTIKDIAWPSGDAPNFLQGGTKHDALDDAKAQARLVQEAYLRLVYNNKGQAA